VKRYGKCGAKLSWIMKRFGKYRIKWWKDRENMEENSEMIWKIWKKDKMKSEMIWKIWKKSKFNSEMIWQIQKKFVKRYGKYGRK
jgi:hypothetical protein